VKDENMSLYSTVTIVDKLVLKHTSLIVMRRLNVAGIAGQAAIA
jgi:hypothetical protein